MNNAVLHPPPQIGALEQGVNMNNAVLHPPPQIGALEQGLASPQPIAQVLEQYTPPSVAQEEDGSVQLFQLCDSVQLQHISIPEDEDEIPIGLEGYTKAPLDLADESSFARTDVSAGDVPVLAGLRNQEEAAVAKSVQRPLGPSLPSTPLEKSPVVRERTISPDAYEGQYTGSDEEVLAAWIGDLLDERPDLPLQVGRCYGASQALSWDADGARR